MTRLTGPVVLRTVEPGAVDRDCVFLPAVRVAAGWRIEEGGRWRRVLGEGVLLGDGEDDDGGRVQFTVTASDGGIEVSVFRRGERVWARAPQPGAVETLGCVDPDCAADGPFTLTDTGLLCPGHLAGHALAETAGPDCDRAVD